ncbi:cGMP-specific 3',5'-cyclic phosphodiesterase [Exaiptasia diaphana]|uniref:Phosphodiesterase n=1 Tax=Exaiptasia diaphana TaxID=2652724 RepID=A0A913XQ44_EXADI|nr:cGMP-specific 3',5'-cyclic phosphodiesterase [Exaiptasia diaphana]KXJ28648.1 cGMP-specific 3',5'-cyclic phosphodiesterase [Exaiptasia diaphana]
MSSDAEELTPAIVEQFLDKNEDFAKSYFERKATSSMVDQWMVSRSHRPGARGAMEVKRESLVKSNRAKSLMGSVTDLKLKTGLGKTEGSGKNWNPSDLESMDEKELFMELIRDIANELDINRLSHKILVNVSILTKADRCSLFLVRGKKEHRELVSKLFDVTSKSTLEESLRSEEDEISVPFGVGIAGAAAESGEAINIKDAYSDPRFNREIDKATGYKTHSILCMPIKSHDGEVVGVAQIINKKSKTHHFTEKDEEVFRNYLTFCGIGITNAQLFEISVQEYKRNQVLLQLAKGIFEEQSNLDQCVHNIMEEAQELLNCERCMVFLIDEASVKNNKGIVFSKAFDLHLGAEEGAANKSANTHWSMNSGIAALVATTGQALNIPDAYADSRFNPEADRECGFKTRSILCMPIFDREQRIVGVAQLLNKVDGKPFYDSDESLFEAFAIFCGLGIHNTMLYEQACKLLAKQSVAMEVLSYHATAQPNEVSRITSQKIRTAKEYEIYTFEFDDMKLTDDETLLASVRMFMELDILEIFHIKSETLFRWLLSVKKNYRPVTYHNWRHAFNVAQSMFTILTTGDLIKYFTEIECFALLVACLCHDLDHRGTNNAFQSKTESALAQLYGTSTMEHHHFDHCIMILNSEGNNIFSELSSDDYRRVIKLLEHAILSTDLALYFQKRGNFEKAVVEHDADWSSDSKKELLRAMMMTVCDVAAITKPWYIQESTAELVAGEFFEQGDIEREQLHSEPIAMMDRRKKDELPKMQVGFIDFICMPIYKLFYEFEEKMKPMYDGVVDNRKNWQALADKRQAEAKEREKGKEETTTQAKTNNNNNNKKSSDKPAETTTSPTPKKAEKKSSGHSNTKPSKKEKKSNICNIV